MNNKDYLFDCLSIDNFTLNKGIFIRGKKFKIIFLLKD